MQNYVNELEAYAKREKTAAERRCKEAREALAKLTEERKDVVAKIIGVPASEIGRSNSYPVGSTVKRWPGAKIVASEAPAWRRHREAEQKAQTRISECCKEEQAISELTTTKAINAFRSFLRARYGKSPSEKPAVAIAAFIESRKPVACKT